MGLFSVSAGAAKSKTTTTTNTKAGTGAGGGAKNVGKIGTVKVTTTGADLAGTPTSVLWIAAIAIFILVVLALLFR